MNVMIMEQKLENFTLELLDLSSATTSGPFPLISHPPLRCRPWKRYGGSCKEKPETPCSNTFLIPTSRIDCNFLIR